MDEPTRNHKLSLSVEPVHPDRDLILEAPRRTPDAPNLGVADALLDLVAQVLPISTFDPERGPEDASLVLAIRFMIGVEGVIPELLGGNFNLVCPGQDRGNWGLLPFSPHADPGCWSGAAQSLASGVRASPHLEVLQKLAGGSRASPDLEGAVGR